jgi:hypothetical protein
MDRRGLGLIILGIVLVSAPAAAQYHHAVGPYRIEALPASDEELEALVDMLNRVGYAVEAQIAPPEGDPRAVVIPKAIIYPPGWAAPTAPGVAAGLHVTEVGAIRVGEAVYTTPEFLGPAHQAELQRAVTLSLLRNPLAASVPPGGSRPAVALPPWFTEGAVRYVAHACDAASGGTPFPRERIHGALADDPARHGAQLVRALLETSRLSLIALVEAAVQFGSFEAALQAHTGRDVKAWEWELGW